MTTMKRPGLATGYYIKFSIKKEKIVAKIKALFGRKK